MRALLSVSNKQGIAELGSTLADLGWELVSSGGTRRALEEAGLTVTPIESVTGNPEAFDGRMKTISFQIESALLYDRTNPEHVMQAEDLGIVPIDLVVCNFYPFERTVADPDITDRQAIEQIDIGGPCMVRAAAKNFHAGITVVVDPADYPEVQDVLRVGEVPEDFRRQMAAKAFHHTAEYERAIDFFFSGG